MISKEIKNFNFTQEAIFDDENNTIKIGCLNIKMSLPNKGIASINSDNFNLNNIYVIFDNGFRVLNAPQSKINFEGIENLNKNDLNNIFQNLNLKYLNIGLI